MPSLSICACDRVRRTCCDSRSNCYIRSRRLHHASSRRPICNHTERLFELTLPHGLEIDIVVLHARTVGLNALHDRFILSHMRGKIFNRCLFCSLTRRMPLWASGPAIAPQRALNRIPMPRVQRERSGANAYSVSYVKRVFSQESIQGVAGLGAGGSWPRGGGTPPDRPPGPPVLRRPE